MNEKFKAWLTEKGYEIKEDVLNEDNTIKEAGTSAEVMAGYFAEYNDEMRKELAEAIKADVEKTNTEAIETIKAELVASQVEQLTSLNKALKEQGLAIKKLNDVSKEDISLTNKGSLKDALGENIEALKTISKDNTRDEITFKVAGDMTIVGNISGGNVPVEQREPGVNNVARRRTFIRDLVNNGIAVGNVISWVEQTNVDGAPAGTVEGTLKNQIDFDLVVVSEDVRKRTAFIKASTEMLGDIDFMRSEIENELMSRLSLDIDNQVLNGDDTGQNLNGIITQATAFAAGTFALDIVTPNLVDVLTVAANQIVIANHIPTVHVVHPSDLTQLRVTKATDEQYINRLQDVAGVLTLDGIPVVANIGIAVDNFLTMDGSKDTVFSKGEITINIGLDGNDFTKNMRTILGEWRGLNRIKGNDLTAFVTGVVSTAITALTKP